MKKLFLNLMFAASFLFAAGCLTTSCSDDNNNVENAEPQPDKPGTSPENPEPEPEPEYNPVVAQLPIKWSENKFQAGTNGVSIETTNITENNVVFNLRPGNEVQSYRFDIFPLSVLYNQLLNDKMVGKTANEIEDKIISYMTNTTGSAGYILNSDDPNYADYELDWANSNFAQAKLVPSASYIITIVPCFDNDGMEPAGLNMVYFKTASKELIGDPRVNIDVLTSYRGFEVNHYPNEDCKFYYFFASDQIQIKEYIDICGEDMYSEFMRQAVYQATPASDPGTYSQFFGQTANANFKITATAIGLDANQTPAKTITRQDFSLKQIPENSEKAVCKLSIDQKRVASTQAYVTAEMNKACSAVYFNMEPKSIADELQAADEAVRKEYVQRLRDGGWGIANANFAFDEANGKATGTDYVGVDFMSDLYPSQEYVMVYIGRNFYDELTDLQFSEPFTTKTPVENNPAACEADVTMEITDIKRTSANLVFKFDEKKLAAIRFQYIYPNFSGMMLPMEGDPREDFMDFFFSRDPFTDSYSNIAYPEPGGVWVWSDEYLEPGNFYKIAYVAEDWNGVMSEVKFASFETPANPGGENPVASIEAKFVDDHFEVDWRSSDAMYLKHAILTDEFGEAMLDKLNDPATSYETMIEAFTYCAATYGLTSESGESYDYNIPADGIVRLVVGLAYGKDDKQSALAYVILKDGKVMTLEDFGKKPAAGKTAAKRIKLEHNGVIVPAATLKNVNVRQVVNGNNIVFLNMNNYGLFRK